VYVCVCARERKERSHPAHGEDEDQNDDEGSRARQRQEDETHDGVRDTPPVDFALDISSASDIHPATELVVARYGLLSNSASVRASPPRGGPMNLHETIPDDGKQSALGRSFGKKRERVMIP